MKIKKLPCLIFAAPFFFSQNVFAQFTQIGVIGGSNSYGYAVSKDGSVVVGASETDSSGSTNEHAFKYQNGVLINLGTINGAGGNSGAYDVSGDGSIIVGSSRLSSSGDYHAFKYSGSTMTDLGTLGGTYSSANGISNDGSIIVGQAALSNGNNHAFSYSGSTMTDLGTLGGNNSNAHAISYDGTIIVGWSNTLGSSLNHAFKYSNSTMTDLGTLGGSKSTADAISDDNLVIVGNSQISGDSAYHAFTYSNNLMTDIGTLGGTNSYAYDTSATGKVTVGKSDISGNTATHAFKYVNGTMTDLGTLGGSNSTAYGVSSDGSTIVGESQDSSGNYHAFIYNNSDSDSSLVDVNNTYSALYYNGAQLNSLINLKNSLLKSTLNQECNKFGANGLCVGVGYRYSNVNHYNAQQQGGNLKFAYRFTPNLKAGIILDQGFNSSDPSNFTSKNSQPMTAFYAKFNQHEDGRGFGAKLAAAYNNNKVSIKRNALENTEAGLGDSNLKSSGLLAEISYGIKFSDKISLKPFAGIRQTLISRNQYTESQNADFPITYNAIKQKFTTAIFGIESAFNLTKSTQLTLGGGFENNIKKQMNGYSGNISQVGSFALNSPNLRNQTAFLTSGIYHDLSANQSLSANVIYSSQALNSANATIIYLGYYFGF